MQNDELFKQYIIENPIISKTKIIGYVYLFYNKFNQKLYVGKTVNKFNLRWNEHKYNGKLKHGKSYIWIYEKDFNEELLKDKIELVKDAKNYNTIIQNLKAIRDYE